MSYRTDERTRCLACNQALAPEAAVYSTEGELQCRLCFNAALVARDSSLVSRAAARRQPPQAGALGERTPGSRTGHWWLLPGAVTSLLCMAQLIEHWASGDGCSELSCIGLLLLPLASLAIGCPTALIALFVVDSRDRARVATAGLAMVLVALGTCAGGT